MHPVVVIISPNGGLSVVANHDTQAPVVEALAAALGPVREVRRGGHVVPAGLLRRAAFRLLRRLFGNRGRAAVWTRTWSGPWLLKMLPLRRAQDTAAGNVLGPFAERDAAVQAEVKYLLEDTDDK